MGIYAIRDRATGHLLLGASRNVHAALNRARFELRMGKHADRVLQAEWNRSGVDGLAFEVLELVKEREDAGFDKSTTDEARAMLLQRGIALLPALRDMSVVKHWAGLRPASPAPQNC